MRTTELRAAQWTEINFEAGGMAHTSRMHEMGRLHIVPLSRQVILALEELKKLNSNSPFLFPNQANPQKCMSENTILYALYRMGITQGQCGMALLDQLLQPSLTRKAFRSDVIECQIAHSERNKVRASYKQKIKEEEIKHTFILC